MRVRSQAWPDSGAWVRQVGRSLILTTSGAALTALGARIAVPFLPVPVTLQVFFVLLCGVALGRRRGAAAQAEYVLAGMTGLPVFTGGHGGPQALFGPTGGYLIGFVAAAYLAGWLTETIGRRGLGRYVATMAGAATILACGWLWLIVWTSATGAATPLKTAFAVGVAPFIACDIIKAVMAAAVGRPLNRLVRRDG